MPSYRKPRKQLGTVRVTVELPASVVAALEVLGRADGMFPYRLDHYLSWFICQAAEMLTFDGEYEDAYSRIHRVPQADRFPEVQRSRPGLAWPTVGRLWWLKPGAYRRKS